MNDKAGKGTVNRREFGRFAVAGAAGAAVVGTPLLAGCGTAATPARTSGNSRWAGIRRYVVGTRSDGKSYTQSAEDVPAQQLAGGASPGVLWVTDTMPVDNAAPVTAGGAPGGGIGPFKTMPGPDGTVFSFIYAPHGDTVAVPMSSGMPSGMPSSMPSGAPSGYPSGAWAAAGNGLHRTDSLDYWVILDGEITLITDTDQIHLKAGDTVVIRGASHSWKKASDKPYLAVTVAVDAGPLQG